MASNKNDSVKKIVIALVIAASLGVFGFVSNIEKRVDKHDVEIAKMGKDIEYIRIGVEELLRQSQGGN